jgi:hypothetical protein
MDKIMNFESLQDFLDKRFFKDPTFVYRRIADECILVPIRGQMADLNYIYVLNPVANRIWELIDGQNRVMDIQAQIAAEFDAGSQEVGQDLEEFLAELAEIGGIREA